MTQAPRAAPCASSPGRLLRRACGAATRSTPASSSRSPASRSNQALDAASVIGDDRIQEQTQGQVNPETWTHGSSEQRQGVVHQRLGSEGSIDGCDTFNADI